MHRAYTEAAARTAIHVLCEKPMALDETECESMIEEAERTNVKLMIAYRLHFERGASTTLCSLLSSFSFLTRQDGWHGLSDIVDLALCQAHPAAANNGSPHTATLADSPGRTLAGFHVEGR